MIQGYFSMRLSNRIMKALINIKKETRNQLPMLTSRGDLKMIIDLSFFFAKVERLQSAIN